MRAFTGDRDMKTDVSVWELLLPLGIVLLLAAIVVALMLIAEPSARFPPIMG